MRKSRACARQLEAAQVPRCCAVLGCTASRLTVHHIQPVALGGNFPHNLAYMCEAHHALIERYVFWQRARLAPETAKELIALARAFDACRVHPLELPVAKARSQALWQALDAQPEVQAFSWWRQVFDQALTWARQQVLVREVKPKRALIEAPWFYPRLKGHSHDVASR